MTEHNFERESSGKPSSAFIIMNTFGQGGAEMSMAILADELAKRGCSVTMIALWKEQNSYNFDWLAKSGVKLHVINESKNLIISVYKLLKLLCTVKPQIIYSAMLYANLVSQICAVCSGVCHIASVRMNPTRYNIGSKLKRISFFLIVFLQQNVVFISRKALSEYMETVYGRFLRRKRIFVLHNPIEIRNANDGISFENKFNGVKRKINDFLSETRIIQGDQAVINFVIVSRLVPGKGIMEILEQIKKPFKSKRLHLSIYGSGPLEVEIQDYIQSEFENHNVVLKGFCHDLDTIFRDSDFIISPSRSEGFGRATFEALLSGSLVICNKEVSIVNEFLTKPMAWKDYVEPFDLYACLEKFSGLDSLKCVNEIKLVSDLLSPFLHVIEFEKIVTRCIDK